MVGDALGSFITILMTISAICAAGMAIILSFFRHDYNNKKEVILKDLEQLSNINFDIENKNERFINLTDNISTYGTHYDDIKQIESLNIKIKKYTSQISGFIMLIWLISIVVSICMMTNNICIIILGIICFLILLKWFYKKTVEMINDLFSINNIINVPSLSDLLEVGRTIKINNIDPELSSKLFANGSIIEMKNDGHNEVVLKFIDKFKFQGNLSFFTKEDRPQKGSIEYTSEIENHGEELYKKSELYFKLECAIEDIHNIKLSIKETNSCENNKIILVYSNDENNKNIFLAKYILYQKTPDTNETGNTKKFQEVGRI